MTAPACDIYEQPELYDALLSNEQYLPFYAGLAGQQGGPVLELACGTGQLAVPIAGMGVATTALDLSLAMLQVAHARAAAAAVSIEFVHGDMRRFDLGRGFALIFVARNSLLHLTATEEYLDVFAAVRRHLLPKGLFAFDIFNPDIRALARPPGTRFPIKQTVDERFGELSIEATFDYDAVTQVNRGTWYVSSSSQTDAWVMPLHLRAIFPQELPLLLAAGGFRLLTRVGDFSGEPFAASSYRQVCVCDVDPEKPPV